MNLSERDDFLHNLVYTYCRWKYAMLVVFFVSLVMVFFAAYLMTPTWQAEAHLLVEPTLPPPTTGFANPIRPSRQQDSGMYARHAIRALKGQPMAFAVVQEFGLDERLRKKREEPDVLRDRIMTSTFDFIGDCVSFVTGLLGADDEDKETDWLFDAAEDFNDGIFAWIAVDLVSETDILELTVNGETPELANDILLFMVEELRKEFLALSQQSGKDALVAFEKELANAKERQAIAEIALQQFLELNSGIPPSEETERKVTELHQQKMHLNTLREDLTENHPDVIAARALVEQISADLIALPAKEGEYTRLMAKVNGCKQLSEGLQSHVNELMVAAEADVASFKIPVIQKTMVSLSDNADNPSWFIVALIALVFAAGVTVVLPIGIEYWRDPIRGPADLQVRGITPLAVIPKLKADLLSTPRQEKT